MRKLLISIIFSVLAFSAFSQASVKGNITDTLDKKNLKNAVISLLQKSDSTLIAFTRATNNGHFKFDNIAPGKYVLLISYPGFADYADDIEVKDELVTDAGLIALTLKARLLETVIIRTGSPIRIKGDTTEFIADSFKVKEGATVEDLLKRLPGFQVNSKGEITAQGQRVGKILVDGEEFFGDDPTMATQNISAKAVDKVQVYDTKSEQQNLTGISSGNETKTVNIKLKEESKKGSFGKVHAGSDFNGLMHSNEKSLVDAKVLFNNFKGKKKFSIYGTRSDISTGSLNWEDRQKLGMENDYEYDEISGYYSSFAVSDEFNDWSLRGLPESYSGGVSFINKWNGDRHGVNGSYRYNRMGTVNAASTLTKNIFQSSTSYRNKFQNSRGLVQQHSPNLRYDWKLDSLASLKYTLIAVHKTNDLQNVINSEFLDSAYQPINKGVQLFDIKSERKQLDNQLQYKQLFKKKNRILMVTLRYGNVEDDQNGVITNDRKFYEKGVVDSTDLADQQRKFSSHSETMGGKISYVEPLGLKWSMAMEYAYNRNESVSNRNTYNKDLSGKYSIRDTNFSSNFNLDAFSHSSSLIFKYTTQKFRAAFGSGVSQLELDLFNIDSSKKSNYRYRNLTPQLSTGYTFKPQTRLNFNYKGSTRNPSLEQLQPVRDNQDRLNIFSGNPDLKVSFNHSFNLNFNTYKTLSQKGFFLGLNANIPVNAIVFLNSVDTLGQQTYTPLNVNGNKNYSMWMNYFKDGGEKKLGYEIHASSSGGMNRNFINENNGGVVKNKTTYLTSEAGFDLRFDNPDKFSFEIGPQAGYNASQSSLQKNINNNYWTYGGSVETMIMFPGKIELTSECDFDLREQLDGFDGNTNQIIWHAALSKKFFKNKSGKIYLLANDILNQRRGFNRNISTNFITEDRYQRISRYFLLKFEWSFNKMPGQSPNK